MRVLPRSLPILVASLCACASAQDEPPPDEGPGCRIAAGEGRTSPSCALDGRQAPLLDQALSTADLTQEDFGFAAADWDDASTGGYLGVLGDPFRLSWFPDLRGHPARAGCFEGTAVWPLDAAMLGAHPVSEAIAHAARMLDRAGPAPEPAGKATDFAAEIAALCGGPAGPCEPATGEVPPALGRALAPVIRAIAAGLEARAEIDSGSGVDPSIWLDAGGNLLLGVYPETADPRVPEVQAYMLGEGRRKLNAAAEELARAIEDARLASFAGTKGVAFEQVTRAGLLRVGGAGPDTYAGLDQVLLLVDLGGDDVYIDGAGTNASAGNAVSVVIDVAGNDSYGYDPAPGQLPVAGLLPADLAGRATPQSDETCRTTSSCDGPRSLSGTSRQGAARNGIAMLLDLGGDDTYRSLRASQGYAQFGVGVLFDGGGDDVYLSEAQSQGAAQFGIGLAIDVGCGDDQRRSITESQGFAYVGGAGFLLDDGGDDVYFCDHGDPARGGVRVYGSPQTLVTGNSSFCQGAGFGTRADQLGIYMSGGIGILRDASGDDRYDASVFAQGTGYWQGTGILSDGGGSDRYQADWYVQGAAAHYSVGMLVDGGPGDDVFDEDKLPNNMSLGSGHDYSVGVLINEAGNDTYHVTTLAVGSSNCNGVGLFVDNGGDDTYLATSDYNEGMGNVSGECKDTRPGARSMGIMIDAGGTDDYQGPESPFPRPANDTAWNYVRSDHPGERGGGVDGTGETGVHAGSAR